MSTQTPTNPTTETEATPDAELPEVYDSSTPELEKFKILARRGEKETRALRQQLLDQQKQYGSLEARLNELAAEREREAERLERANGEFGKIEERYKAQAERLAKELEETRAAKAAAEEDVRKYIMSGREERFVSMVAESLGITDKKLVRALLREEAGSDLDLAPETPTQEAIKEAAMRLSSGHPILFSGQGSGGTVGEPSAPKPKSVTYGGKEIDLSGSKGAAYEMAQRLSARK